MHKRFLNYPKTKQHLYSSLLSVCCMAAAAGISALCYHIGKVNSANIAMIFIFFIVIVSSSVTNCIYGIACAVFAGFCFHLLFPPMSGYFFTLLGMAAISVLVNRLISYITTQTQQIAEHERQLVESEKEKMRANLLRAVSHDLRTPLTAIIGNSQSYLENQSLLTEQEKTNIVQNICEDSNWLVNMVENLLTITRIRDDGMTVSTDVESVEEVISEAIQKTENRHLDCVIHARVPDHFIMLPMDAVLIEQVTINLLDNALRHSDSDAPIELIVEDDPDNVFFTVRDHGKGIPKDMLSKLFDGSGYPISQVADAQRGMGIGLTICKTIISAHRGTLIGHNHGQGAEFTFVLPKDKEAGYT